MLLKNFPAPTNIFSLKFALRALAASVMLQTILLPSLRQPNASRDRSGHIQRDMNPLSNRYVCLDELFV